MSKIKAYQWLGVIIVLLAAFVVLSPLIKPGFFITDDGDWMVIRLSAFYQSLREGQFPVRFLGRLNSSYGYPVANFLYPGYLYLGSVIHAVGISYVDSVKLIFFGSVVIGSFGSFFWLRRRFGPLTSTVGAIGYAWSPYLLFDIYKRGSVGEVLAMGIVPLALWAMETERRVLFAVFIAAIIVSHNSLAALFVSLLLILVLLRQQWKFLPFIVSGLCMSAFFWFPALFEQRYVIFSRITVSDPNQYFVPPALLVQLGVVYVGAFILAAKRNFGKVGSRLYLVSFIIALILATPLSLMVWKLRIFAQVFQFPYRFLSLVTVLGPWVLGLAMEEFSQKYRWLVAVIVCFLLFYPAYQNQHRIQMVDRPDGYYSTNEATTTVADEYLPIWARVRSDSRAYTRIQSFQGDAQIEIKQATTQRVDAVILAKEPSTIQINTLYYPGWGVMLNGVPVKPDASNEFGVMRIRVPAGTHRIYAEFRETVLRFCADMVSLFAFVITLGYPFFRSRMMKNMLTVRKKAKK